MSEEINRLESEVSMLISKVEMLEQQISEKVSKTEILNDLEQARKIIRE